MTKRTQEHYGGFTSSSMVKNPLASAEDPGLIPQSGRSHGEGNGNPLQYCCLENPMGRGAWQATVHVARVGQNLAIKYLNLLVPAQTTASQLQSL